MDEPVYKNLSLEDLPGEKWKYIPNTNDMYKISNLGRIVSFHKNKISFLHPNKTRKGYARVAICFCNAKRQVFVHRLVAEAFLQNPYGYKEINHKDGNKLNNEVNNLEFCTSKYNTWHKFNVLGYRHSEETREKMAELRRGKNLSDDVRRKMSIGHIGKKRSADSVKKTALGKMKKVVQMTINNEEIAVFNSIKEASEKTGTLSSCICSVCNGKRKTSNGYKWRYI